MIFLVFIKFEYLNISACTHICKHRCFNNRFVSHPLKSFDNFRITSNCRLIRTIYNVPNFQQQILLSDRCQELFWKNSKFLSNFVSGGGKGDRRKLAIIIQEKRLQEKKVHYNESSTRKKPGKWLLKPGWATFLISVHISYGLGVGQRNFLQPSLQFRVHLKQPKKLLSV